MLKAGSSSVGAWLHALDSSSRPAEFSRRLFGAFEDNELAVSRKFLSWIFGPDGLGASVCLACKQIIAEKCHENLLECCSEDSEAAAFGTTGIGEALLL